ncbi:MAG: ATP-binding protein, partial [Ottowia sp.]|nr:ATP-binding protein [Ottowia sp.]
YTAFLAQKLEAAGDAATAKRLRKALEENDHQLRPAEARFARALPIDSESRFPLVEQVKLRGRDEPPLQLTQAQWDVVHEFVSVAKSYGSLVEMSDLAGAMSLLMYGAPGTGKSRLARYIANELGLDLYVARLDGLISSFLGSTAKNIRALFDFAAKTPCVLFLDEFDAIAKVRGDDQEMGELKRVVNSFLQNLDSLGGQSIVLAATNHENLLDAAVWRRFTYRVSLDLPDQEQRQRMWGDFLGPLSFSERELTLLADISEGFTGSDIREASARLRRRQMASGQPTSLKDIFPILLNLALDHQGTRFASQLQGKDANALVHLLRARDERLYSLAVLAELLGLSKATVHRMTKMEGEDHGD